MKKSHFSSQSCKKEIARLPPNHWNVKHRNWKREFVETHWCTILISCVFAWGYMVRRHIMLINCLSAWGYSIWFLGNLSHRQSCWASPYVPSDIFSGLHMVSQRKDGTIMLGSENFLSSLPSLSCLVWDWLLAKYLLSPKRKRAITFTIFTCFLLSISRYYPFV